jgi:hypothetical protein
MMTRPLNKLGTEFTLFRAEEENVVANRLSSLFKISGLTSSRAREKTVPGIRLVSVLQIFGNVLVIWGVLGAVAAVVGRADLSYPTGVGVTLGITLAHVAIAGAGWVAVATAKCFSRMEERLNRMYRQQSLL